MWSVRPVGSRLPDIPVMCIPGFQGELEETPW